MQFPHIHLNGSDGERLLEEYLTALRSAQEALSALRMIEVNNRDYYTISADAGNVAMNEHRERCFALQKIISDLEAIAEHISDQL